MEDIIDIIVTETTNTIEITSQASDELIDVNIIDNREDITLNVTPTLVEININSLTGNFGVEWGDITGTLADQTDLNTALGLKADLVGGKVPSSQLPSYVDDIVEVANYAALPATGETGKIYVVLDTNKIYRWSGSAYIEIADSTAVWGAITGTLSSQTDLQNALNAKFDDPTGDTTQYIAGDGSLITFPVAGQAGTLVREVRNTTGATLTKGTIVYISGATGNKPTVSKAIATGDSTSAQTFGMCQANISNNSNGYVVCVGDLTGIDTSALTEGQQLYLSSTTAGAYTTTKQLAPAHLVYIGVVTRSHPTLGQIEVKIQNGYELDEIHDVAISSVANNDGLFYESSSSLWKNKSIATVLGYTPANGANYLPLAGGTMTGAIVGTTATFTNSGSGIGLGVTLSGSTGDGIKITHSAGRAFNIQSSGSGYGFLINNETASTSAPFTIQKQGLDKITFTDAGVGSFASSLTASSFVKSGGTSAQYLMADGSVSTLTNLVTGTGTSGIVAKFNGTSSVTDSIIYDNGTRVSIGADVTTSNKFVAVASTTSSYAVVAQASGAANGFWATLSGSGEIFRGQTSGGSYFIINNGGNAFLNGNLNVGDFASTSYRLNVVGTGNFTGALSGTSASFTNSGAVVGTFNRTASSGATLAIQVVGSTVGTLGSDTGGNGTFDISSVSNGVASNNVQISRSGGTPTAFFSSSGNVGIGTTAPAGALQVSNNGYAIFNNSAYSQTPSNIGLSLGWNRSGGNGEATIVWGSPASSYKFEICSYVSSTITPRFTIDTAGNVGIGTTSPAYTLDVLSASNATARFKDSSRFALVTIESSGTNQSSYLEFKPTGTGAAIIQMSGSDKMAITSAGNVGIGTTAPVSKFHSVGTGEAIGGFSGSTYGIRIDNGGTYSSGMSTIHGVDNTLYGSYQPIMLNGSDVRFGTSATERMRIRSNGSVGIGTAGEDSVTFEVKAASTSNLNYAVLFQDSNAADLFYIRADGLISTGLRTQSPYNTTTGAAANAVVASDGILARSTSSLKYKKNVLNYTKGLSEVMQLRPVSYQGKNKMDEGKTFAGLIAEEVHDLGLTEFVQYAEDGTPDALAYQNMVSLLIKGIQELKAELDILKNK